MNAPVDRAATRSAPTGFPWPEGHGLRPQASGVCLCGRAVVECDAMTKWGQHREKKSGDGGPVEYEYDVTEPMVTNQTYFVRACSREEALRRVLEHDDDSIILVEMGFVVPRRPMSVRDVRRGRRLAPRLRDPYPQEGTP